MNRKKKNQQAFTLIELLVVATIIIVLTTLGLVSYRTVMKKSKQAKCQADIEAVRQALVMHRSDNGSYLGASSWTVLITNLSDYLPSGESFTGQLPAVYSYDGSVVRADTCGEATFTASLP
jgi:prepilin-type N-terminal cleavage/methylation domain-containing protein